MKSFFVSVGREFRLIFRNGISIFMVAAPAILAVVFLLVFGAVNETTARLAVDHSLDAAVIKRLTSVADIESFDDTAKMEARVRGADTVAGVMMQNGAVTLIFEGNEGQQYRNTARELVGLALAAPEEGVVFHEEAVAARGAMAYTLSMMAMLLLSLFIGGATIGLSMVDERESGAIRAVEVSPLRLSGYVTTKIVPALVLSLAGIGAVALIVGNASLLPRYLLLAVASTLVSGMMSFALGAFASNQIAAIGVLKILVPLGIILPLSAIFVPEKSQFFYYILPMYWQYRSLNAIMSGAPMLIDTLLTLLVSIPWFAAAVWYFSTKTDYKTRR